MNRHPDRERSGCLFAIQDKKTDYRKAAKELREFYNNTSSLMQEKLNLRYKKDRKCGLFCLLNLIASLLALGLHLLGFRLFLKNAYNQRSRYMPKADSGAVLLTFYVLD